MSQQSETAAGKQFLITIRLPGKAARPRYGSSFIRETVAATAQEAAS